MPEECAGGDFEASSNTEMVFGERELVAVVIVTTDPGVDRVAMFVSFVTLAVNKLDTGNIGSLCVCKHVSVETNSSMFISLKIFSSSFALGRLFLSLNCFSTILSACFSFRKAASISRAATLDLAFINFEGDESEDKLERPESSAVF